MHDANVSDDLRQLPLGQVKALEYDRNDINGYRFWTVKLEASHPLVATTNSGVVANGENASGLVANYYGVLQKIIEYTFGGSKELKVVFSMWLVWSSQWHQSGWFSYGGGEAWSRYSDNNLLFAH
jgi:hypothetical protein